MSGTEVQPDRMGNWLRYRPFSMWGLNITALIGTAGGVIIGLFFMMAGQILGMFICFMVTAVIVATTMVRFGEQTLLMRLVNWFIEDMRSGRGETTFVNGPFSTLPAEAQGRLPGALCNVDAVSGTDGLNEPYTLLHYKDRGLLAAVLGCEPDGAAMQETAVVNAQVASYGGYLAGLSVEDGLRGASVVIDSAATSSAGMIRNIHNAVDETAPPFARDVLTAASATLPARSSTVSVYSTLVYSVADLGGRKADLDQAKSEIAARIPGLCNQLAASGGGAVSAMTEPELAEVALVSYAPKRARERALDALGEGTQSVPPSWHGAGPEYFDDDSGRVVFHDGVASMTAMMTKPPAAHITARTFDRLFGPDPKFLRKRAIVFYRPMDPGTGIRTVNRHIKNTNFGLSAKKTRVDAFESRNRDVAQRTEQELTQGARLTPFSMMVTVTFEPTNAAYQEASTRLKQLLNAAQLEWRWVENAGSAAFHSTLPFGVLPWLYTPMMFRDAK